MLSTLEFVLILLPSSTYLMYILYYYSKITDLPPIVHENERIPASLVLPDHPARESRLLLDHFHRKRLLHDPLSGPRREDDLAARLPNHQHFLHGRCRGLAHVHQDMQDGVRKTTVHQPRVSLLLGPHLLHCGFQDGEPVVGWADQGIPSSQLLHQRKQDPASRCAHGLRLLRAKRY